MSAGLDLIDLMKQYEEDVVPLKEISRQINRVAIRISELDTLFNKWKVGVSLIAPKWSKYSMTTPPTSSVPWSLIGIITQFKNDPHI